MAGGRLAPGAFQAPGFSPRYRAPGACQAPVSCPGAGYYRPKGRNDGTGPPVSEFPAHGPIQTSRNPPGRHGLRA